MSIPSLLRAAVHIRAFSVFAALQALLLGAGAASAQDSGIAPEDAVKATRACIAATTVDGFDPSLLEGEGWTIYLEELGGGSAIWGTKEAGRPHVGIFAPVLEDGKVICQVRRVLDGSIEFRDVIEALASEFAVREPNGLAQGFFDGSHKITPRAFAERGKGVFVIDVEWIGEIQ